MDQLSGIFVVNLNRDGQFVPWGFRLQGGADHMQPLQIQRVFPGSPAEGHLQRGDTIMRIQNHDTSSMTHLEAHDMFKNAGNHINMTVHRAKQEIPLQTPLISHMAGGISPGQHHGKPAEKMNPYLEHPVDLLPAVHVKETIEHHQHHEESHYEMHSSGPGAMNGNLTLPRGGFSNLRKSSDSGIMSSQHNKRGTMKEEWQKELEKQAIHHQAYRTLPLITPSVKVKRDLPIGSYLRFQYDPKAGPPKLDDYVDGHSRPDAAQNMSNDAAMKQKVADAVTNVAATMTKYSTIPSGDDKHLIVNKQFNSPVNLYSKENIQQAVQEQTGLTPPGIPMPKHYDPLKSPTYHALQEMEDRSEQKPVHAKIYTAPTGPPPGQVDHRNALGVSDSRILQSYSFNRVMMDVLGESVL